MIRLPNCKLVGDDEMNGSELSIVQSTCLFLYFQG